ncbi:membrane protein insertase YidC [Pelomonas sp. KK5]|uniref:membrane protein insertase YidC n=1 Tax=Pelomonas sp. KK5 TaxID=1855730 RepID=UPI00097C5C0C|nr:membrane protein insertase YidC [Pelomonas sp. KK5]
MTDMRRTVLWVVFLASLFMLWDGWQKYNGHPSFFAPPVPKPVATAPALPGSAPAAAASPALAGSAAGMAAAPVAGEKVTIHTDVLTVTLDTLGGDVTRVELPRYKAAHVDPSLFDPLLQAIGLRKKPEGDLGPTVLLNPANGYKAQSGLAGAMPNHLTPMTLAAGERDLKDGVDSLTVRLESAEVGGVKLIKTYTFKRGSYVIDMKDEIANVGAAPVTPQAYVQLVRDASAAPGASGYYSTFTGPAVYNGSKYHKVEFKSLDKYGGDLEKLDVDKTAQAGWVAMVQHYFASAWLHNEAGAREFFVRPVQGVAPQQYAVGMLFTMPQLAPGASTSRTEQLFVGPQEENDLEKIAPGLELVKDYGIFAIISKPLFWLLDNLHKMIGNWGWAIIALVLLLKMAFYWLNARAYSSMAKMKAVNPKIAALRERLKDKPQEMQQEMMRIYREEKINPLGGCLPIFVQMPVFIGLYWVLLSSVEMRGTPWLGWIHDLSVPDPFFILPTLMTITSLFQVWLQPTPPDPTQAKMMWFMPLAFSFMFFSFPAGLTLYYVVNNVLTIAQQWVINKRLGVKNG